MITISNIAKQKLKNLIVNNSGKSAYLYLKSGGCNGFNHTFSILDKDEKPNKYDEVFDIDDKHNLYICSKSLMYIIGSKIDYIEDLMGSRFDFSNDNIAGKCGCGTSVNFKP